MLAGYVHFLSVLSFILQTSCSCTSHRKFLFLYLFWNEHLLKSNSFTLLQKIHCILKLLRNRFNDRRKSLEENAIKLTTNLDTEIANAVEIVKI